MQYKGLKKAMQLFSGEVARIHEADDIIYYALVRVCVSEPSPLAQFAFRGRALSESALQTRDLQLSNSLPTYCGCYPFHRKQAHGEWGDMKSIVFI